MVRDAYSEGWWCATGSPDLGTAEEEKAYWEDSQTRKYLRLLS